MTALQDILSSKGRAEIFRLLFGLVDRELHVREMERQSGLSVRTVQQELVKLADLGLLQARRDGNRLYYRAHTSHPLYPEIHGLVLKTCGLAEVLRKPLHHKDVQIAFVFGSLAQQSAKAESDVDLMVIGKVGLRQVVRMLSGVSARLGREINSHAMTVEEFKLRRKSKDHFISNVLESPKIFIHGVERELEAMVG